MCKELAPHTLTVRRLLPYQIPRAVQVAMVNLGKLAWHGSNLKITELGVLHVGQAGTGKHCHMAVISAQNPRYQYRRKVLAVVHL